jgi:predicted phosphodiesterase
MDILSNWKRYVAVTCSHGKFISWPVANAAIKFATDYGAETRVHLGDWTDQTALRSGAKGTPDEAAAIPADLQASIDFMEAYRPTHLLNGNHDRRAYRLMNHPNSMVSFCSRKIIEEMRTLAERLSCQWVEHYSVHKSWIELGGTKFLHGWMYNEMAIRDHAETFGNCVMGHLHTRGSAIGRTPSAPVCHCAGLLADIDQLSDAYAGERKATLRWSNGLCFGEYSDKSCVTWGLDIGSDGTYRTP